MPPSLPAMLPGFPPVSDPPESDGNHTPPYLRSQTPARRAQDNVAHNGSIKAGGEGLNNFILSGLIGEPKFSVRRLERNVPACGYAPSVWSILTTLLYPNRLPPTV